jgi:hypothetical protein
LSSFIAKKLDNSAVNCDSKTVKRAATNSKTSTYIRSRIERGGERLWRMDDFRDHPFPAVAQEFSRMARKGTLQRISKGVYYRPRQTSFGPSRPSPIAIRQLAQRTKSIFPSGLSAANLLGLSTQTPRHGEVSTSSLSLPRKLIGSETRVHVRRPEAWKELSEMEASILDTLRNGGRASELPPEETTSRILQLLSKEQRLKKLLAVAKTEPPRVRALLGALAEALGTPPSALEKLQATLNLSSRFNFGQFAGLPTAREWLAKDTQQA